MNKKLNIILGFLTVIFVINSANSQNTVFNDSENLIIRQALNLYEEGNYGSALELFDKYMKESDDHTDVTFEDAAYYSTVCAVELKLKDDLARVKSFVALYPSSAWIPSINFQMGNIYFQDKKYSEALEIYGLVSPSKLDNNDRNEYYYKKGYCQMKQSMFDAALASYKKVMGSKSRYSKPANYYYAHLQYQKGNYREALATFEPLANDRKYNKYIPLYLAKIYYQLGEYNNAVETGLEYIKTAKRKEKGDLAGIIANSYYMLENYTIANEYYNIYESYSRSNQDYEEQYRIGYCKFVVSDYGGAISNFQEATKNGGIIEQNSWYYLGYCYLNTSQIKFAQSSFIKAYKLNTNKQIATDALFAYIKVTIEAGNDSYNDPVAIIEEFIQNNPDSPEIGTAYDLLSQLYLTSKNYSAALKSIEKVSRPDYRLKQVYQQLSFAQGLDYFNRRSYSDAIVYFQKSLLYPIDEKLASEAYFWQGDSYYRQKDYYNASLKFDSFIKSKGSKKTSKYNEGVYNLAYCAFNQKQYKNAIKLFNKFNALGRNDQRLVNDTYLRLADCYLISKDYNNAIAWYNKVIQQNSSDSDYALYQKAICYGSQGDFNKKISTLGTLVNKFNKSHYYDDALYEIASTNLILNDQRHAIAYFDKLVKERPKSGYAKKALVKMGFVYYSNNQYDQAIKSLRKVIDSYPASLEAKEALVTLQSVYMDMGQVDNYIEYTKSLDFVQVSTSEEDSLKFVTGENYYINNDCVNAVSSLEKYLSQFPNGGFTLTAYHYLSQCYKKMDNKELALKYFQKIIEYPENQYTVVALLYVARDMFLNEEYEKSLAYYERLGQLADNKLMLLEANDGVMKSAWNLKNYPIVKDYAHKLLMTEKVNEDQIIYAHYLLGIIAVNEKNNNVAEKELNIVSKLSKSEFGAEATYNLALINYRQNKLDKAEEIIYQLPEKFPSSDYWIAKSFILLADIYVGRDNIFQAEQTLSSVIENYKGEDLKNVAQQKLERLKAAQIPIEENENIENNKQ